MLLQSKPWRMMNQAAQRNGATALATITIVATQTAAWTSHGALRWTQQRITRRKPAKSRNAHRRLATSRLRRKHWPQRSEQTNVSAQLNFMASSCRPMGHAWDTRKKASGACATEMLKVVLCGTKTM